VIRRYIPALVTSGAGLLIALGIWAGEVAALWEKAAHVCLSCIGIG